MGTFLPILQESIWVWGIGGRGGGEGYQDGVAIEGDVPSRERLQFLLELVADIAYGVSCCSITGDDWSALDDCVQRERADRWRGGGVVPRIGFAQGSVIDRDYVFQSYVRIRGQASQGG